MVALDKILQGSYNILGEVSHLEKAIHNEFRFVDGLVAQNVSPATNDKPLIIGFTPPEITVNFIPFSILKDTFEGTNPDNPPIGASAGVGGAKVDTVAQVNSLGPNFWSSLKATARRLKMNPEDLVNVLLCESGMNPSAHPPKPNEAHGLNQLTRGAARGMGVSDAEYEIFKGLSAEQQLPYVERYFKTVAPGASYANSTAIYLANFAPAYRKFATSPETILYDGRGPRGADGKPLKPGQPGYNSTTSANQRAYDANKGLDKSQKLYINVQDMTGYVDRVKGSPGYRAAIAKLRESPDTYTPTNVAGQVDPRTKFAINVMGGGITNSSSADSLQFMGRELTTADAIRRLRVEALVSRINRQIKIMKETPGLIMLINPSNLVQNYEQSVDLASGRKNQIVSMWLEKPLKISATGVTSGFYAASTSESGGGLSHERRIQSLSYLNLMSMVSVYLNNGVIYNSDELNEGIPVFAAGLYIYYDGKLYLGSFDRLSITDSADKPYSLSYSFTFNVRYKMEVGVTL